MCYNIRFHPMKATDSSTAAPVPAEREKVTICIIAGNEEKNIRRCLESVRWADEIVVVDSFSRDRTFEIAKEYTDRVYQQEWRGYVAQKALAKSYATMPWVMFVDADEEVSEPLRREILSLLEKGVPEEIAGFDFPRMVWFLNRWIRHGDWYPDRKLRLFRRDRGSCGGAEPHDRIYVQGRVGHLHSPLFHYTYDNIEDQFETLNRFSRISASGQKPRSLVTILWHMVMDPPYRFFRCYVLRRGFLDGVPGYIIASAAAFGTFAKYAKLWERLHALPVPGQMDKSESQEVQESDVRKVQKP